MTITLLPTYAPTGTATTHSAAAATAPPALLRRTLRPGSLIRVTQEHIDGARETRESNPAYSKGRHSAITYAIRCLASGYRLGVLSVDTEARSISVYYCDPATGAPAGYAQIALPTEAVHMVEMEDCGVWDKMAPMSFRLGRCLDADAAVLRDFAASDAAGEGAGQ